MIYSFRYRQSKFQSFYVSLSGTSGDKNLLCRWTVSVKLITSELVLTSGQMVIAGNGIFHTGFALVDSAIITGVWSHFVYDSCIIRQHKQTATTNITIQKILCNQKARRKWKRNYYAWKCKMAWRFVPLGPMPPPFTKIF